jgi:hypothetical protein
MPAQGPGVSYDTVAREWRCKWSDAQGRASVGHVQAAWEAVAESVRATPGVVRVQRMCCGTCMDYKIIVSMSAGHYAAWAARQHTPENEFLTALRSVDGVTQVEAQLYSIMDA